MIHSSAPDFDAWLRRNATGSLKSRDERQLERAQKHAGTQRRAQFFRDRPGMYEGIVDELEAVVRRGEGFDDPMILEYAYLALRREWDGWQPGETFTTPFDDPPEEATTMSNNGRRHWRIRDICEQYDISRVTLDAWRKRDGFPEPIVVSPPVWDAEAIEEWRSGELEAESKRRADALTIADTGDLEAAAEAAKVSTRTIRRWQEQAAREE